MPTTTTIVNSPPLCIEYIILRHDRKPLRTSKRWMWPCGGPQPGVKALPKGPLVNCAGGAQVRIHASDWLDYARNQNSCPGRPSRPEPAGPQRAGPLPPPGNSEEPVQAKAQQPTASLNGTLPKLLAPSHPLTALILRSAPNLFPS